MIQRMARPVMLALVATVLLCGEALAETVVLKSGKRVKATAVEVSDDAVKATLAIKGGTAIVTYTFAKLDPASLLVLLERHWIAGSDATADGAAALRIAGVAQRFALLDEAVIWLVRAAEIDPALTPKRDAGLETIRMVRVNGTMRTLESLLKGKDPAGLVDAADEALAGELGLILKPAEALRIAALRGIAQKMIDRAEGAEAVAAAPAAPAAPPAPAVPGLSKKMADALEKVDAALAKASSLRDKATDPALTNLRARKLLESAAKSLLDARRIVRDLTAPLPEAAVDRAAAIEDALVTTWLDVADLYRQARAFDAARRYLRAARLIDPESTRAKEIEAGLVRPESTPQPYDHTLLDWIHAPGPYGYTIPAYGLSRYYGPYYRRYGTLGFHRIRHYGFRIGGHGHHHHRGSTRRVVGRRR